MIASAARAARTGRRQGLANPGHARRSPRGRGLILRVLWHWRDARRAPGIGLRFHVMSNDDIVRIAEKSGRRKSILDSQNEQPQAEEFPRSSSHWLSIFPEGEWPGSVEADAAAAQSRANRAIRALEDCQRQDRRRAWVSIHLDCCARGALEAASIDADTPLLMRWQRKLART